jgi:hypothetical protein
MAENTHCMKKARQPRGLRISMIRMFRLAPHDWKSPYSIVYKLNAWRYGFRAETFDLLNLTENDPADYVSEWMRWYKCTRLNCSSDYFRNKLTFRSILLSAGIPQPETFALCAKGRILLNPLGDLEHSRYVSPYEFVETLISDGDSFVLKPDDGARGEGIFLLRSEKGRLLRQSGTESQAFSVSELPRVALIERRLKQGLFWSQMFPHTVNTIRILVGWIPNERHPSILCATQRIGTRHTVPTDNVARGAISAPIDLDTGKMTIGLMRSMKSQNRFCCVSEHPETNARIEGVAIPNWDRIRTLAIRASACSPMHRYVGWDLMVNEEGTPVIIEGNGNSDVRTLQFRRGLLADPLARRFYELSGAL